MGPKNEVTLHANPSVKELSWIDRMYQKLENICVEVDKNPSLLIQETSKYVENQMNAVGTNVKKLCAELIQDLLPPPILSPEDMEKKECPIHCKCDCFDSEKPKKKLPNDYEGGDTTQEQEPLSVKADTTNGVSRVQTQMKEMQIINCEQPVIVLDEKKNSIASDQQKVTSHAYSSESTVEMVLNSSIQAKEKECKLEEVPQSYIGMNEQMNNLTEPETQGFGMKVARQQKIFERISKMKDEYQVLPMPNGSQTHDKNQAVHYVQSQGDIDGDGNSEASKDIARDCMHDSGSFKNASLSAHEMQKATEHVNESFHGSDYSSKPENSLEKNNSVEDLMSMCSYDDSVIFKEEHSIAMSGYLVTDACVDEEQSAHWLITESQRNIFQPDNSYVSSFYRRHQPQCASDEIDSDWELV